MNDLSPIGPGLRALGATALVLGLLMLLAWAVRRDDTALREAHGHDGVSVVHVPVYAGTAPEGGLGAYGSWNVGNWCDDVQRRYQGMAI